MASVYNFTFDNLTGLNDIPGSISETCRIKILATIMFKVIFYPIVV